MKTQVLHGCRWSFTITTMVLLLGCIDETTRTTAQTISEPGVVQQAADAPSEAVPESQEPLPQHAIIPPASLSPGLADVIQLAQSGVSEQVLLAYVEKTDKPFHPSVDEIVYLKDIGVSDTVIAALVRHSESTNEIPQSASVASVATNGAAPSTYTNGPSLIDPNAPSYSVAAETNYSEASAVSPAPQEVNINYFENSLSPYGSWIEIPEYGRCWQPTVVLLNRSWRPYADRGRWIYTSCGWYWQSDYSWGWAPFHYGRWYCDNRVGWVWVPGTTWGPAWVSWRYTDQYCGWAPLPPSARYYGGSFYYHNSRVGISFDFGLRDDFYTFIPTSRFCDRTPSHHFVHGPHSRTLFKNSVVINNYIRGNNNTIINEGVGKERITRATHTPIRTVALRELPADTKPPGRAERLEGNSLTVFRPELKPANTARTVTQRSLLLSPRAQESVSSRVVRPSAPTAQTPTHVQSGVTTPNARTTFSPKIVTRSLSSTPSVSRNLSNEPKKVDTTPAPQFQPTQRTVTPQASSPAAETVRTSPRSSERAVRRTEIRPPQFTTPAPAQAPQISRETPAIRQQTPPVFVPQQSAPAPSVREIRRSSPAANFGSEQRSIARPAPVIPAPSQNAVREIARPNPVQPSAPSRSITPSVRQSAPRQEAPASRTQRSVERSNPRAERNRS